MWFKNGLKAQKLQKQHALKGQKLLAQGIALGIVAVSKAPCKGKSFVIFAWGFKAFALTGRQVCVHDYPGRCPGLRASALSGRAGACGGVQWRTGRAGVFRACGGVQGFLVVQSYVIHCPFRCLELTCKS